MKFHPTTLAGSFTIEMEPRGDNRGYFARAFCLREFSMQGLETQFVQMNISRSVKRGTLRGIHYQRAPAMETKLVRCIAGALYDVIVDLRPDSPTFLKWFGQELSTQNLIQMYIPRGFAHGFMTLTDNAEIQYLVSNFYSPDHERGVRFNDPRIGIRWPEHVAEVSPKDANWPDFDPKFHGVEDFNGLGGAVV
jgi:dTDP-4-dehydrorhamnose 3,5-epimerase